MSAIEDLVTELERSYRELQERMSDPAVYNDHREAADRGRRLKVLEEPHRLAQEWSQVRADLEAARADGDLKELVPELEARLHELEAPLRDALAPADPDDDKDAIVEIRQGVGGDEAALWAGAVYRMLTRYAERRGLKVEQLGASPSDGGGYKEVTFAVKGNKAYGTFKWEAGTHRVQRVPTTESQGRIHTSSATVAVMPEAEEVEVEIDPNDLKIDVYRSTGPGGQSVNTTDSAVRTTHLPSGVVVSMQDDTQQIHDKDHAEWLVAHVLGVPRSSLPLVLDREVEDLEPLLRRREAREPLAYVLGEWGFRRLTLKTDARALVPRPETEIVVERALASIRGL